MLAIGSIAGILFLSLFLISWIITMRNRRFVKAAESIGKSERKNEHST